MKRHIRELLFDLLFCLIGTAFVALAIAVFNVPNDIAPGGVSGMATALASISPIRVGVWTLLLNVPLLLAAWRLQGPRPLAMTLIATVRLSFFIDFFDELLPGYTNNPLLAAVFFAAVGLLMGLKFANLNWTNEIYPIKQSMSVLFYLLLSIAYGAAVIALYFLVAYPLGHIVYLLIVTAVTA